MGEEKVLVIGTETSAAGQGQMDPREKELSMGAGAQLCSRNWSVP